jgi:hypothetical protein
MLPLLLLTVLAGTPSLEEGRRHFKELEFDAAAAALAMALAQPGLSPAERREATDLRAQSLLAVGRTEEADGAYADLLGADPHAPGPEASAPKVQASFLRAKQRVWPRPSVALSRAAEAPAGAVAVSVQDPWGLVRRVRWLEALGAAPVERPAPPLEGRVLTVVPSPAAQRALFDALAADGTRLAHLEVALVLPAGQVEAHAAPPPRWVTITLIAASVAAAGLGATFLGLGFRAPPAFSTAAAATGWNQGAAVNVGLGWTFAGLAVGSGVAAAVVATR